MSVPTPDYPLMDHQLDTLRAGSGKPVEAITLQAAASGELSDADWRIIHGNPAFFEYC